MSVYPVHDLQITMGLAKTIFFYDPVSSSSDEGGLINLIPLQAEFVSSSESEFSKKSRLTNTSI